MTMKLLLSSCLATMTPFCLAAQTSFSDDDSYPKFCSQAAHDQSTFLNFKRAPAYTPILEHVSSGEGGEYLKCILRDAPDFAEKFDEFRKNDILGNPSTYIYGEYGAFSPTTLRYIKVASDLRKLFGSLDHMRIIEIGGGYGGQCLILSKLFAFQNYTIVDLPGPLALTDRYLQEHELKNYTLKPADELTSNEEYDLVISNYAFTECLKPVQAEYLEKILAHSKRGYITCNMHPQCAGKVVFSKEELNEKLSAKKIDFKELPEEPLTSPQNYILVFPSSLLVSSTKQNP